MPKILLSCFTRREVEHVQHRLGTYYVFDSYRPEGKYRFDVGKKLDVDALCHLIGIKQKIHSSVFKFARLYELTSRANYQSVDKVENYLSGDNFPESGILELEYSIPDTAEAHAEKRMVVESELAQLERAVSVTRADQLPTTLSSLGFEYGAGARAGDDDGDSEDEHTKKAFDFKAAMNRTRTEYKLVSVLHADKAGIVKCTDMAEKPFNSYWDGGKTTIVCMLEDKDQKCRVQVVTPRGVNEYTSLLIHWDSPFKTTLDIGHVEEKEEGLVATALVASARPSSGLHLNRMKKFEEKKNSPAKQKTIPKKGGKGLRPVTPETFSNVKSLDFGLALRRSQGTRMHKPWTGFARTDPDDFRIQKVTLKAMSQHKDVGGVISKKVTGSLGPSSCVNYEFDLFMLVSMHTVPRFFTFQLTPAVDMHLYISTRSLPWEKDYIWKGETSEIGDKVVVVRPTDRNYEASKYYVTIVSGADPGHYSFVIEVSPYFPSLKYVDTLQFPRFSATKAVKILRSGPAPPPKVADLTSQNSKAGKMLSSLMNFTEERKSKSCFGAAVPDKALMTITTGLANRVADTDLRPGNSASFDPDSLRSSSAASIRSRDSLRSSSDRSSPRILAATH